MNFDVSSVWAYLKVILISSILGEPASLRKDIADAKKTSQNDDNDLRADINQVKKEMAEIEKKLGQKVDYNSSHMKELMSGKNIHK